MHRFYLPSPVIQNSAVIIKDARIVYQASKVLRMRTGQLFSIFDEEGVEQKVKVVEIDRKKIVAEVIEPIERNTESPFNISLYQSVPKKTALFELIVQKATELGVSQIFPLITERTEKRRISKFDRLVTIATEATEQCNRTRVPVIRHPVSFETALEQVTNGYLAYEFHDKKDLLDYKEELKGDVQILIGPEGGLSRQEVEMAEKAGLKSFSLGPRILRTETAAIAALSQLLSLE